MFKISHRFISLSVYMWVFSSITKWKKYHRIQEFVYVIHLYLQRKFDTFDFFSFLSIFLNSRLCFIYVSHTFMIQLHSLASMIKVIYFLFEISHAWGISPFGTVLVIRLISITIKYNFIKSFVPNQQHQI